MIDPDTLPYDHVFAYTCTSENRMPQKKKDRRL